VEASRVLFGGSAPAEASVLLEQAMVSYGRTEDAERLLWEARRAAPDALPVYFSLYKFYFYKGDLANAELAARMALLAAARQGAFDADWRGLTPASADWSRYDGPAHFYLFSLKALSFIRLRQGDRGEALAILAKLAEIDPADSVGASVIRSIAEGAE
jgi:tetratricopeptide (TPR) repeat protein